MISKALICASHGTILASFRLKVHRPQPINGSENQHFYGETVKVCVLKSDPNEFVTTIGPDVAPTGTTAVNEVELTPVTEVIVLRPIFTGLTPSKPTPEW